MDVLHTRADPHQALSEPHTYLREEIMHGRLTDRLKRRYISAYYVGTYIGSACACASAPGRPYAAWNFPFP